MQGADGLTFVYNGKNQFLAVWFLQLHYSDTQNRKPPSTIADRGNNFCKSITSLQVIR